MNIGFAQIRGALLQFFKGKVLFYIPAGCCLQFLKQPLVTNMALLAIQGKFFMINLDFVPVEIFKIIKIALILS